MDEGWWEENYLIIYSAEESHAKAEMYKLSSYLPGYRLIGLNGWDDFLVAAPTGELFSVPTIPITEQHLQPFRFPSSLDLKTDDRFLGKIKWYTKPIVFGGDPNSGENLVWIDHEQHVQLVNWWNDRYRAVKGSNEPLEQA